MKAKLLTISAAVMALLAVSCQREETGFGLPAGEEVTVTLSASVPTGGPAVKSDTEPGNGDQINRCILQIYMIQDGQNEPYGARRAVKVNDDKTAKFEDLTLITGYQYRFVFWADHVADADAALNADLHYLTTDFPNISFHGDYRCNDDTRDAFFGVFATDGIVDAPFNLTYNLTRPFGQLNIFTTDYDDVASLNANMLPARIKLDFENIYTGMNLLTGDFTSGALHGEFVPLPNVTSQKVSAKQLSFDYIFAPDAEQGGQYLMEDFTMTFCNKSGTEILKPYTFNEIPVRRNYSTNVTGSLLTDQADLTITVTPDFGTPDETVDVETVSDISDVNAAIIQGADHIQVENAASGDIVIPQSVSDDRSLSVALNEVKGILTVRDEDESNGFGGSFAISSLSENQVSDKLVINLPRATASVNGGLWSEVYATTAENTVIIGNAAEVETLTVQKGNAEIYGKVNSVDLQGESSVVKVYTVYDDVSFGKAMALLVAGKCERIVLGNDITLASSYSISGNYSAAIDINNHLLTSTSTKTAFTVENGAALTLENGRFKASAITPLESYAVSVNTNASLILESVILESNAAGVGIHRETDGGSIAIRNSSITALSFAVGTNASAPLTGVEISLENSEFSANSTVLFNIPSKINISGCTITGINHALILRGGEARVENSTLILNDTEPEPEIWSQFKRDEDWGSGNAVPYAALTVGNRHATNYQYPTALTLVNCNLRSIGENASYFPAMYVYANDGENGVNITYDSSTSFGGDVIYASDNIIVNEEPIVVYEVSTLDELITAMPSLAETGGTLIIAKDAEIDLSSLLSSAIRITKPTIITVYGKLSCINNDVSLINESTLTINGSATSEVRMKRRVVENYGTLTVNGGTYYTDTNNGGTLFWNNSGSAVMTLNDVTANASFYCVAGMGRIEINGGQLNSTASNKNGEWAYCISAQDGCQMVIRDAEVNGVQGAISSTNSSYVLCENVRSTARNSDASHQDAFYALYAASDGGIEVLSGEYLSDRTPCCLVSDNDISSNPLGYFILKGGKYGSMPQIKNKNGVYSDCEAYTGYKFQEITGDSQFKYEIVVE